MGNGIDESFYGTIQARLNDLDIRLKGLKKERRALVSLLAGRPVIAPPAAGDLPLTDEPTIFDPPEELGADLGEGFVQKKSTRGAKKA